jgi:DNA polymerase-1
MRTLLIDSDILAYQHAAGNQEVYQWDTDVVSVKTDWDSAVKGMNHQISEWMSELDADDVIVCLTDVENFRKNIMPTYKANRAGTTKPEMLFGLKAYLTENYRTYIRPGLEADDVMGILSTHPKLVEGEKIIVSIDKDMKTVPGWLFNPDKDLKPRLIEEEEADYWHLYQTLVGDSTDGYPGAPGIGHVKAKGILCSAIAQEAKEWRQAAWEMIVEAFKARGLGLFEALQNARVARILRASDYDFKRKEVRVWQPTWG